ncbi:MAG: hypothetical protein Terrestrivirus5_136 [Terrestrivirus sp.]|uniref:Uncharacterized protein n=1 Tax=Terrestrivirus sp. TaxID=2487775 RepID=A0A3G4ZPP5_9VIRU|nr:MAG: hypothetical protein Terrestrivirus5_136 [Terrestrivirus sp.]
MEKTIKQLHVHENYYNVLYDDKNFPSLEKSKRSTKTNNVIVDKKKHKQKIEPKVESIVEPIVEQQNNEFSFSKHSHLLSRRSCRICYNDISENNYVLCKKENENNFEITVHCSSCVERCLKTQFETFLVTFKETVCIGEIKRVLRLGIPKYVRLESIDYDRYYFTELYMNKKIISGRLEGGFTDERANEWLESQKVVLKFLESTDGANMVSNDNKW